MEKSLIAMLRMNYGPGKRGTLSTEKASQSQVVVSRGCTGELQLTYTALSTPFSISQFTKGENQYFISLRIPKDEETEWDVFQDFRNKLLSFSGRFVHLQSKELEDSQFIVGTHKGKLYCATKEIRPEQNWVKNEIEMFLNGTSKIENDSVFEWRMEQVKQYHKLEENSEIARVYAKVAMNTLAYLKGDYFVKKSTLDDFRKWILYGAEKQEFITLPNAIAGSNITNFFPDKAHWCLFTEYNGYPYAVVSFYGVWQRSFRLTKERNNWFLFPQGFVCDWKNKKEYTLMEYVDKFIDSVERTKGIKEDLEC